MNDLQKAQKQEKNFEKRKWGVKLDSLPDDAYDLAQIIKHLMIDRESTNYVDKISKKILKKDQCRALRSRSVEDLFVTTKNYIPTITYNQVQKAIETLIRTNILISSYCDNVRRVVHSPRKLKTETNEIRKILEDNKLNVVNKTYVRPNKKA